MLSFIKRLQVLEFLLIVDVSYNSIDNNIYNYVGLYGSTERSGKSLDNLL